MCRSSRTRTTSRSACVPWLLATSRFKRHREHVGNGVALVGDLFEGRDRPWRVAVGEREIGGPQAAHLVAVFVDDHHIDLDEIDP